MEVSVCVYVAYSNLNWERTTLVSGEHGLWWLSYQDTVGQGGCNCSMGYVSVNVVLKACGFGMGACMFSSFVK